MKKFIYIFIGVFCLLGISYFMLPKYTLKAIIYQSPGIKDYEIFENRKIDVANAQPWAISKHQKKLDSKTFSEIESYQTTAYIVIQNDSIQYESYWDDYSDSTISGSFSVSKSIVSLLVGIALEEGKIKNLEQPITDFILEMKCPENNKIRIIDLLTMSSGLNWEEKYGSLFCSTTEAYYGDDLKNQIIQLKGIEEPGKKFKYLSANTQLLALIVERATGKNISDYTTEKIWKPIGAEHPALWCLDKKEGCEKAYCCFNATARDFARIGALMLNKGKWKGKQIVPEKYMNKAISPAEFLSDETGNPVEYYGYQFWILSYKAMKIPYARGILGQYIFAIPEKNAIVVRLGHKRSDSKVKDHPSDINLYLDAALKLIK